MTVLGEMIWNDGEKRAVFVLQIKEELKRCTL